MSQPTAAATAAAPAPATPAAQNLAAAAPSPLPAAATPAPAPRDTPRELRRLSAAAVALGLAFGLLGLTLFALLTWSMQRANAATAQTVRVQEIQTSLLRADANATNAFLVGGLEPAEQRDAYASSIATASRLIAAAAQAEPADQAALARLNGDLVAYTENIERARANNRQGFPIGAQYLRIASTELRADALPVLDALVDANAVRASSQMSAAVAVPLVLIQLLLLGALVWVQVRLARRFKRRFNVGLAVATGIGLVSLVLTVALSAWAAVSLATLRDGTFADVRAASNARVAANDAKSQESLTLIARGSGGAFEEAWQASSTVVDTEITRFRDLQSLWQPYVTGHTEIRTLDDGGQWDKAVQLATSRSNQTFDDFDAVVARLVDSNSATTTAGLSRLAIWMVIGGLLAAAAGAAMAVLGRRGIELRLKEYR